ncbi:MAG TPA: hypothetical protein VGH38_27195, partial [Bryobacteraceae bacterium]
ILALLTLVGLQPLWPPLAYAGVLLMVAMLAPTLHVLKTAGHEFHGLSRRYRLLTMALHLVQPVARLSGRLNHGLTPWRSTGESSWRNPLPEVLQQWSEQWHSSEDWLAELEGALMTQSAAVARGGEFDRWDLQIRGGLLGGIRIRLGMEEHGSGKQLLRWRVWPVISGAGWGIAITFDVLAVVAAAEHSFFVAATLGVLAGLTAGWALEGCGRAKALCRRAVEGMGTKVI